jgi:hypothetical protein
MLGTSTRIWPDNYGADMSRTAERLVPPLPLPVLTTRRGAAFRARDSSLTAAARRSNCSAAKNSPGQDGVAGARKPLRRDEAAHNSLRPFVAGFRQQSGAILAFQRFQRPRCRSAQQIKPRRHTERRRSLVPASDWLLS